MIVLSALLSYLSVGLFISLIVTMIQHSLNTDTVSPITVIACTLLWPNVISSFIYNIEN